MNQVAQTEHKPAQSNVLENDLVMYGLARTDIVQMTSGMIAAHLMHAQQQATFEILIEPLFGTLATNDYREWMKATSQGFGTTLSLNTGSIETIHSLVYKLKSLGFAAGVTFDPTFPFIEGETVTLIPMYTAGWVFGSRNQLTPYLKEFNLL